MSQPGISGDSGHNKETRSSFQSRTSGSSYGSYVSSSSSGGQWAFLYNVKQNELYNVGRFQCNTTGMNLVHARIPGPHFQCYWVIPHKLQDDLGLPHILQHMLWQGGSKQYPNPGLLQRVANRSFSSGLKSWVEKDYSCYYMTSAGRQGFDQLLPLAFDHIFDPDLQESTFLQEVYSMQGNGEEGGVCFQEMQRTQSDPGLVASQALLKSLFGEGSGYGWNFNGTTDALSQANLEVVNKVKEFHRKFFNLSNCMLVISGEIERDELLFMVSSLLTSYRHEHPWTKVWADQPLITSVPASISVVEYPSTGGGGDLVQMGILGPHSTEKLNRCVAMRLVLEYLASGPILDAIMSSENAPSSPPTICFKELELRQTVFIIEIGSVPQESSQELPNVVRRCIEDELSDLKYNKLVESIQKAHQFDLVTLENQTGEKICRDLIPDFIYSKEEDDVNPSFMFDRRVNSAYTIHHFLNQKPDFWKLVITIILEQSWVTKIARGSSDLADQLVDNQKSVLDSRMSLTNINQTKRLAQRSKAAFKLKQKLNEDASLNLESLEAYPIPPVGSIGFTKLIRYDNPKWLQGTLCNVYFDDINSNYVFVTVMMDTGELSLDEKKYLVLLSEALLESPYVEKRVLRSADELKMRLKRDCLQYETFFGLDSGVHSTHKLFSCGIFSHLLCLRLQLDVSKVKEGFLLAHQILWKTIWQPDVLKEICGRLVRKVDSELKSQGPLMTRTMLTNSLYKMNSNPNCASMVRQKIFLRKLGDSLPVGGRRVSKMLDGIRKLLLRPENMTVHVAGSLPKIEFTITEDPNARHAVTELFKNTFDFSGKSWGPETKRLSNEPDATWMKSQDCIAKCCKEQILRMEGGPQIGFLLQASAGLKSWSDPDYPLALTVIQYFLQDGGPLKTALVDGGLAKDIDIRVNPSEGLFYFEMRECPNLAQSYGAAYDVIARHMTAGRGQGGGGKVWDELLLASAKTRVISTLSDEEDTPHHIAYNSLLAHYIGVQDVAKSMRQLMEKVAGANMQSVQNVADKYLGPLFLQPCTCAATAPKDMAIPIIKELLERCGKRLTMIPPLESSFLASYHTS